MTLAMTCDFCGEVPELCDCHGEPPEFQTVVHRGPIDSYGQEEEIYWDHIEIVTPKYPILHQSVWWQMKSGTRVRVRTMTWRHAKNVRDMLVKKFGETVTESPLVVALDSQLARSRPKASNIQKAKI